MRPRAVPSASRFRPAVNELEARENPASFLAFGADAGGTPTVDVVRPDGTVLTRIEAYDAAFRGGVRAAVGELDGNPDTIEVITAPGPGGGPHVKVFGVNAADGAVSERASFFAFDPSFTGGVRVAAGRFDGSPDRQQIVVAADAGGGPRVRLFDFNGGTATPATGPLADFFAFAPSFTGGVRVAAGELDENPGNGDELVVGAGSGGGPRVLVFGSDGAVQQDYFAFDAGSADGVNVDVETSGVGGRIRTDQQAGDFSQRNANLNAAAFAAVAQSTGFGGQSAANNGVNNTGGFNAATGNGLPSTTAPVGTVPLTPVTAGTPVTNGFPFGTSVLNPVVPSGVGTGFGTTLGSANFGSPFGSPFGSTGVLNTTGIGTTGVGTAGSGINTIGPIGTGFGGR